MNVARNKLLRRIASATIVAAFIPGVSFAQRYPDKAIRFVVAYGVGGNADLVARIVGQRLGEALGVQVVIDNRPGAGGNLGAEVGARAAPDGYTIVLGTNTHASNMSLYRKSQYDLVRDFTPVSFIGSTPVLLTVTPSLPVHTVQELIALAKAKPGQLNYASGGSGSSGHLTMELFKTMAGVDLAHITYKGAGGGMNEVIAGQIQVMFSSLTSLLPHVNSGRLRGVAVASLQRVAIVQQLPTIAESGLPGFEAALWNALMVPAGTPQTIVERLNVETDRVVRNPEVIEQLRRQGFTAATKTPPVLAAFIGSEVAKWSAVVKAAGARAD
jgi:tripartite-type tricarboxylate transporter receptor subunit TctC